MPQDHERDFRLSDSSATWWSETQLFRYSLSEIILTWIYNFVKIYYIVNSRREVISGFWQIQSKNLESSICTWNFRIVSLLERYIKQLGVSQNAIIMKWGWQTIALRQVVSIKICKMFHHPLTLCACIWYNNKHKSCSVYVSGKNIFRHIVRILLMQTKNT